MQDFSIGISGLTAAQKAFETIGNNIANAATDGYHRQRVELTPAYSSQAGNVLLGGGVDVAGVIRMIDVLLQKEIFRQQSSLGQVSQELAVLRTVENAFGELSAGSGLNAAIDEFFNALQDLAAHPTESIWQNQAVTAAEGMAGQFRTLGEFLTTLEAQITLEAENAIEQVNVLTGQIAELNDKIERQALHGAQANNLLDQRDQCIVELSRLIGIETQSREYGVVDVRFAGIPVVTGTFAVELEVGLTSNLDLGIAIAGESDYRTNVQGGQLSGLLSLRNELVSDIHDDLDDLASAIVQQINQYHLQGVGSQGSFTELTGSAVSDANEEFATYTNPSLSDGSVFIRITNTSTGAITREQITVDADAGGDTLTTLATAINALSGVSASLVNSRLYIQADSGYVFDFLPAVLPTPTASTLTGSPPIISVSGIYTGTANDTFTFTVSGTGSVGNGTLQLVVTDSGSSTVATLNVGSGYAVGDQLDLGNGIKISLTTGSLNDAETFQVAAFANIDTSGVLAAVGINTLFSGSSASDIAVRSDIAAAPRRMATALGADMTDNTNAVRMAGLREQAVTSLNTLTFGEFYRRLIVDIGQQVSVKKTRQDNIDLMVQNLANQQSQTSGVDINEEAAQLLMFEQMFKAMAKYLNIIQSSLSTIMEII